MEENKTEQHEGTHEPVGQPLSVNVDKPAPQSLANPVKPLALPMGTRSGKKKLAWGLGIVLVLAVVGLGCYYYQAQQKVAFDENVNIKTGQYQALFLTNGQVYFGHLSELNNKYVSIKDIYYLQVQQSQSLQQGTGGNTSSQISLAKLGTELHGPEDKMYISSDQVLFWENLKNDSEVTKAIAKYQSQ